MFVICTYQNYIYFIISNRFALICNIKNQFGKDGKEIFTTKTFARYLLISAFFITISTLVSNFHPPIWGFYFYSS